MKIWKDEDGTEFSNSDVCFGREYKPDTDKVDVAKISIRGEFPDNNRWGYLEEAHEMAVVIKGEGYIESKTEGKKELKAGDVVYVEPLTRFRWGGSMDLIVPCGPAFDPKKHQFEEAA
jgi:mannose-6-phosphate isomerase-like protein (cupin superfamily)